MDRRTSTLLALALFATLALPKQTHADYLAVADDLEAASTTLGIFEFEMNENMALYGSAFDAILFSIDGGSFTIDLVEFVDAADGIFYAAEAFRTPDLSLAADELENSGHAFNALATSLNTRFGIIRDTFTDAYDRMNGSVYVPAIPHSFSNLGNRLINAADHLRLADGTIDPLVESQELANAASDLNAAGNVFNTFATQLNENFSYFTNEFNFLSSQVESGPTVYTAYVFGDLGVDLQNAATDLHPVPEPSALIGLGSLLTAAIVACVRRRGSLRIATRDAQAT